MNGWICLHRKILEWEWYEDINTTRLFTHLLLKANYKENNWRGVTIKRGQLVTSVAHLVTETGLSVSQVRTCINKLKSTKEITSEPTNKFTLITLVNYRDYQDEVPMNDKQENTQDGKRVTNESQSDDNQIATNNNNNKDNKDNKEQQQLQPEGPEGVGAEDDELPDITILVNSFEKNYGKVITPAEGERLKDWLEDFPSEVIDYAIKETVISGKRTLKYTEGILRNWQGARVRTLEDAREEIERYEQSKVRKAERLHGKRKKHNYDKFTVNMMEKDPEEKKPKYDDLVFN